MQSTSILGLGLHRNVHVLPPIEEEPDQGDAEINGVKDPSTSPRLESNATAERLRGLLAGQSRRSPIAGANATIRGRSDEVEPLRVDLEKEKEKVIHYATAFHETRDEAENLRKSLEKEKDKVINYATAFHEMRDEADGLRTALVKAKETAFHYANAFHEMREEANDAYAATKQADDNAARASADNTQLKDRLRKGDEEVRVLSARLAAYEDAALAGGGTADDRIAAKGSR